MTKEILIFNTLVEANQEKKNRVGIWRPLHTDFVDNKWKITFVNEIDDPDNSQESQQKRVIFARQKVLSKKLQDNTITFEELKEYLRS